MNASSRLAGLIIVVTGFLVSGRTSESAPAPVPKPVASAAAGDAVAGKETFTQYCSICHGAGGKGFIGPHIGGINWTTPGLHAIVRGGVGGYGSMPAFNADAVTDKNIADIAAYLASLAPAPVVADNAATPGPMTSPAASPQPVASTASAPAAAAPPAPASSLPATPAAGDPIHGRQIYTANCAACHGASGQGGVGPNLHGEHARKDTAAAIAWIKNPKLPMPKLYPDPLSAKDVQDVAAYVESL